MNKGKGNTDSHKYQISSPVQGTLNHGQLTDEELRSHNHHQVLPKSEGSSLKMNPNKPDRAPFFKQRRTIPDANTERRGINARMTRLPSGSQLPTGWSKEMDRAICYLDASGIVGALSIVMKIKEIFPELSHVSLDFILYGL